MVPEPDWFLYGFIRKEAVLSSQIEGTQATLCDVATFEATSGSDRPARRAIDLLERLGVLRETTGKQRDRVYAYHAYLDLLTDQAARRVALE